MTACEACQQPGCQPLSWASRTVESIRAAFAFCHCTYTLLEQIARFIYHTDVHQSQSQSTTDVCLTSQTISNRIPYQPV